MITKKILSIILTTSIIATSFTSMVQISAQTESASSKAVQVIAAEDSNMRIAARSVESTEQFIISGEDDFAIFMTTSKYWGGNYNIKLACNIDMKGKVFKPIEEFSGKFDGCGHVVSNFKIQYNSGKNKNAEFSFIKTLTEYALIKNVKFNNYTIEGGSGIEKAAMLAVTNHGTVLGVDIINGSISKIDEKANAAGFIFNNEGNGIIEDCYIENINAKYSIRSGFVGINNGKIRNSSTTLSIYSANLAVGFVIDNDGDIEGCSCKGNVRSDGFTGGFCGNNSGKVRYCEASGNVKGQGIISGGFAGINSGKIENCNSSGNLEINGYASDVAANLFLMKILVVGAFISSISMLDLLLKGKEANAGGFCGNNLGEINFCNSESDIKASSKIATFKIKCGGFVGNNEKGKITGCVSRGSAEGQEYVGGFCGRNAGDIINCKSICDAKASTKINTNRCGGFVGENIGKIKGSKSNINVTGEEYVGGFAGVNKSEIIDCNASGKATAKTKTHTALAGGFVGENEKGTITNCMATGGANARSSLGNAKAGGFVGVNKASIMSSKASGNVYLSAGTFYKDNGCGGFVGKNDQGGSIYGCYAEVTVETTNKKKGGGFVGEAGNNSAIKSSNCKSKVVLKKGKTKKAEFCYDKSKKAVIENCTAN